MQQGGTLALIGTFVGLGIALLSGRIVASQLYTIRASDPMMLLAATVLVAGPCISNPVPEFTYMKGTKTTEQGDEPIGIVISRGARNEQAPA